MLASLRGVAGPPSVLGTLWRRRLGVHAAAWLVSQVGRLERERALRDAWVLTIQRSIVMESRGP